MDRLEILLLMITNYLLDTRLDVNHDKKGNRGNLG